MFIFLRWVVIATDGNWETKFTWKRHFGFPDVLSPAAPIRLLTRRSLNLTHSFNGIFPLALNLVSIGSSFLPLRLILWCAAFVILEIRSMRSQGRLLNSSELPQASKSPLRISINVIIKVLFPSRRCIFIHSVEGQEFTPRPIYLSAIYPQYISADSSLCQLQLALLALASLNCTDHKKRAVAYVPSNKRRIERRKRDRLVRSN